jgi:predicted HAD superfamily phosphohydrolase YqeG
MMNLDVLQPTECVTSFRHFELDIISEKKEDKGWFISCDLDGSIIGQNDERISDPYLEKFEELAADERVTGFGVLSNAGADRNQRAHSIADQVAEATSGPVITITSHEVGHLKPHRAMWRSLSSAAGVEVDNICHIGDQLPKDVWGGNYAGCGATVLVPPFRVTGEHPGTHYAQRPAEAVARLLLGLPFRTANFGKPESAASRPDSLLPASANDYRIARRICAMGAFGFAAAAGIEADSAHDLGEAVTALFSGAMALEFIRTAAFMKDQERWKRLFEKFSIEPAEEKQENIS